MTIPEPLKSAIGLLVILAFIIGFLYNVGYFWHHKMRMKKVMKRRKVKGTYLSYKGWIPIAKKYGYKIGTLGFFITPLMVFGIFMGIVWPIYLDSYVGRIGSPSYIMGCLIAVVTYQAIESHSFYEAAKEVGIKK